MLKGGEGVDLRGVTNCKARAAATHEPILLGFHVRVRIEFITGETAYEEFAMVCTFN